MCKRSIIAKCIRFTQLIFKLYFNDAFKCDFHIDIFNFEIWQAGFNVSID